MSDSLYAQLGQEITNEGNNTSHHQVVLSSDASGLAITWTGLFGGGSKLYNIDRNKWKCY